MQKLGIDFDGVIQDSSKLKVLYCQNRFGVEIPQSQSKREYLVSNGILTLEQYNQMVDEIYETELGLAAEMVNSADRAISILAKNFEILIVTSRSEMGVKMAKKWLVRHGINEIEVTGTNNEEKLAVLNGFDHYVDDDLSKLLPLIGHVKNLFLFSWEYNRSDSIPVGVKRVSNWNELGQLLKI